MIEAQEAKSYAEYKCETAEGQRITLEGKLSKLSDLAKLVRNDLNVCFPQKKPPLLLPTIYSRP
jgi:hypothetical protein